MYQAVGNQYLAFRREYFRDPHASLATEPPPHPAPHQTETAKLAENALKVVPHEVRSVPIIGDLITHLQRVIDIHTLTENELLTLHNVAMIFLYGTRDGLQPWYVEYLLDAAHKLSNVTDLDYFITYPWHGLFYLPPEPLSAFDTAVRTGDVAGIERAVSHTAAQLITALKDPFKAQEDLAFAGEGGERRKTVFTLKTTAALAIGAYLAIETVRSLVGPHHAAEPPKPVIETIPSTMQQYLIPRDQAGA